MSEFYSTLFWGAQEFLSDLGFAAGMIAVCFIIPMGIYYALKGFIKQENED